MDHTPVSAPGRAQDSAFRRLDRAVERVLAGDAVIGSDVDPRLLDAARRVRLGLPVVAPGPLFEARLAGLLDALRAAGWRGAPVEPSRHRRLITGAIGSAAVSLAGVTAFAVWRAAHRHS